MKVHDEHIPEELYGKFLSRMPQVSIELFLERDGEVLLARRNNEPLKGEWFWPGSRLRKGEELEEAAHRVAREELGIEIELGEPLGVFEHFWEGCEVEGVEELHTVNVVFRARPKVEPEEITLDEQHGDYRWVSEIEPGFHEYVERYLEESGLLNLNEI